MLFRILVPEPGVYLERGGPIVPAKNTDSAVALALLALNIGQKVHRNQLAEAMLPVNPHQSVTDLLEQRSNRNRVAAAVSWLRNALPEGEERVPKHLTHGGSTYYKLNGTLEEVDAWGVIEDRAHAERALGEADYMTALAAASHGLESWAGPLRHKFFAKTSVGLQLRDRLTDCQEDLFGLYTDAATGLGGEKLVEAIRYLDRTSSERPEFNVSITYNLIRLHQAQGDDTAAWRLRRGIDEQQMSEVWTKRMASLSTGKIDDRAQPASRQNSLVTVMPAGIQVRIMQLDPANRAQTILMEMLATTTIHRDFRLFIVSGISAAGKDTLIASAREDATIAQRFEILTKYTTRPVRNNEASYSRSVNWDDFLQLVENGQMAFLYEKRQQLYGFDLPQLHRAITQGMKLVTIFTEFDQVPEARRLLGEYGAAVIPILISADYETAVRRTRLRQFSIQEQEERIGSIVQDLGRMSSRTIDDEYIVIPHTNDYGFNSALVKLRQILDGTAPQVATFVQR